MAAIRVLIADDSDEIRNYFHKVLSREQDMEIVGMAKSGAAAYEMAMDSRPDVIIMDIGMDTCTDGIDAIAAIKYQLPAVKCIVLTIHEEDEYLFKAYTAGAMDYLVKTTSVVNIITSIRNVYINQFQMRPEVAERILGEFSRLRNERASLLYTLNVVSKLTNSEIEIIRAIACGDSYAKIARDRNVVRGTIKTQVGRILKKFEKSRMSEVIMLLREMGIADQL